MNQEKLTEIIKTFNTLEKSPGLKLKDLPPELISDNPTDFIYKFQTDFKNKYETVGPTGELKTTGYYTTTLNKLRSINEIFDITQSYFPDLTVEQYFQCLFDVVKKLEKEGSGMSFSYCNGVKRYVSSVQKNSYYKSYECIRSENGLFSWPIHYKNYPFLILLHEV